MKQFALFVFLFLFVQISRGENLCSTLFNVVPWTDSLPTYSMPITGYRSFAEAMTKGHILDETQNELFDIYIRKSFGSPHVKIGGFRLSYVYTILKKFPALLKNHFREYELVDKTTSEVLRVRSLSIIESPFRACLGGDCSTQSYFDKALDPNFYYFTITDSDFNSNGQATVVLGTATSPLTGQIEKIAFLDKLQNMPNHRVQGFLAAISYTLAERGYQLGIPKRLREDGADTGISIYQNTENYLGQNVLPFLSRSYLKFTPHPNEYDFPVVYSNSALGLDVLIYDPSLVENHLMIQKGQTYSPTKASIDLKATIFLEKLALFKNSNHYDDLKQFLELADFIDIFQYQKIYSVEQFLADLFFVLRNANLRDDQSHTFRAAVVAQILLLSHRRSQPSFDDAIAVLSAQEIELLSQQIKTWKNSQNYKKRSYLININYILLNAVSKKQPDRVRLAFQLGANFKYNNSDGETLLELALAKANENHDPSMEQLLLSLSNN